MSAGTLFETRPERSRALLARLLIAVAALALVGGAVALLVRLGASAGVAAPPKNPFGIGVREAAPGTSGLGSWILAVQGSFYRSLQGAVTALKADGAPWPLMAIGFAYGVFHAAGPGHGKAVIAAYLVANERALKRGLALSLAAALLQALVAVTLVGVMALLVEATAATMSRTVTVIETASFVAVAVVGAVVTWRKAGKFLGTLAITQGPRPAASACDGEVCGHVHLPSPALVQGAAGWRDMMGLVLAAGLRPCAGAIVVLVFALSQGLFGAGVAATFAMALGTAITTGAAAIVAVFAKSLALRLAGGRGAGGAILLAGTELLAAAFVLVLGLSLLIGLSGSGRS